MTRMALGICLWLLFSPISPARVIYGIDNRRDFYQISQNWQQVASSTVALIKTEKITALSDGSYTIKTQSLGKSKNLCELEPFYDQQKAAFCSGTLVSPEIVLTAGHCVPTPQKCQETALVFDFSYFKPNQHPNDLSGESVYFCKDILRSVDDGETDYALLILDRPVIGKKPVFVRDSGVIDSSEELVVIGHSSGLPTKWADGGRIRHNDNETYFVTTLDSFHGNSGSGVFNKKTGLLEGILVRGEMDYIFTGKCWVNHICAESECRGEDVVRVSEVLPFIPEETRSLRILTELDQGQATFLQQ